MGATSSYYAEVVYGVFLSVLALTYCLSAGGIYDEYMIGIAARGK